MIHHILLVLLALILFQTYYILCWLTFFSVCLLTVRYNLHEGRHFWQLCSQLFTQKIAHSRYSIIFSSMMNHLIESSAEAHEANTLITHMLQMKKLTWRPGLHPVSPYTLPYANQFLPEGRGTDQVAFGGPLQPRHVPVLYPRMCLSCIHGQARLNGLKGCALCSPKDESSVNISTLVPAKFCVALCGSPGFCELETLPLLHPVPETQFPVFHLSWDKASSPRGSLLDGKAACWAHSLTQGSIPGPWDHDLSWNQEDAPGFIAYYLHDLEVSVSKFYFLFCKIEMVVLFS